MPRLIALLLLLLPGLADAQAIDRVPYDQVAASVPGVIRFDSLPEAAYPGYNLDHGLAFPGGHIGEHFTGQQMGEALFDGNRFDALDQPRPSAPLTLEMGPPGQTVSVSLHRVFGSNVLYPLGPAGQPDPTGRGEGAAALILDTDICMFGLKVHTQYEDAFGTWAGHEGRVELLFFARDGALIDRQVLALPAGISELGFARAEGRADIAGVQVLNLDPGGISMDDIRYGCIAIVG